MGAVNDHLCSNKGVNRPWAGGGGENERREHASEKDTVDGPVETSVGAHGVRDPLETGATKRPPL